MELEIVTSAQKVWKNVEGWANYYRARSPKLVEGYGRGCDYLKVWPKKSSAQHVPVADGLVCFVGAVVKNLAANVVEKNSISRIIYYKNPNDIVKGLSKHLTEFRELSEVEKDEPPTCSMIVDNGYTDEKAVTLPPEEFRCFFTNWMRVVLKQSDSYMLVTLCHAAVMRELLKYSMDNNICITAIPVSPGPECSSCSLPYVFFIRASSETKPKVPDMTFLTHAWHSTEAAPQRLSVLQLPKVVKDTRKIAFMKMHTVDYHEGQLHHFEVVNKQGVVRYRLTMYDRVLNSKSPNTSQLRDTIAIMVPIADQHHWLYLTPSGHQRLAEKAGCLRVFCVFLPDFGTTLNNMGSAEEIIQTIRSELGPFLLEFSTNSTKPVLLMTQQETFADERCIVHTTTTPVAGNIMVFDVVVDEEDEELKEDPESDTATKPPSPTAFVRRTLMFESNPRCAQTEVWYRKDDGKECFHFNHITHSYHLSFLNAVLQLKPSDDHKLHGALLGVGGGVFASLLDAVFKDNVHLECVDIDPGVVDIARTHFGFDDSKEYRNTVILDASEYIGSAKNDEKKFDFIVVDINGSGVGDVFEDVTGPYKTFLQPAFLENARSCVKFRGYVMMNSVCQTKKGRDQLGSLLKEFFSSVCAVTVNDELNVVFVCSKSPLPEGQFTGLRKRFLEKAENFPILSEIVTSTPFYLGQKSKCQVSSIAF